MRKNALFLAILLTGCASVLFARAGNDRLAEIKKLAARDTAGWSFGGGLGLDMAGWVAREYMMNYREIPRPHPEMFDNQGNLIPDEVIAFNFENYYDNDDAEEDHDD